ncbi:MAG: UDP-4-amino-4,6-dideoxy-N-acetyl-beta-L-altrosamine transaminase [Nitrospirae bacterium RBG_13_39_12]|nr:MAG: UDP-4-amino-4,6-dideoxy-N-acetyl-beta-L-altrosamine transaminase [Nitrospirae bacterium RBG_13_39_12]
MVVNSGRIERDDKESVNIIPYSRQYIDEEDINEVVKVLKSDFITQGPKIPEFEKKLAEYCGSKYAVVFNSGTSALHGAYFTLGLKKGDEFITTPNTFVASANAGLYLGAKPVFVDVEKNTGNIDPTKIEKKLTKKTKLIVPVHYAGHPADLEKIYKIAKKYNFFVVEDACHALGAKYRRLPHPPLPLEGGGQGKGCQKSRGSKQNKDKKSEDWTKIGSCKYSDMTVLSFHPVKHITTGEGGAVLTNNEEYYKKLLMFRSHGITKDKAQFKVNAKDYIKEHLNLNLNNFNNLDNLNSYFDDWYYEMLFLGYNYRMTDIQAALGLSQLKKLDSFVERRRAIADCYNKAFRDNPYFDIPDEEDYAYSSYHLYPIRLKDKYKDKKRDIFSKLRKKGLGVQVHYIPVYLQPYYKELGYKKGLCPVAEDFYMREISIPIYPHMSKRNIKYVITTLKNLYECTLFCC